MFFSCWWCTKSVAETWHLLSVVVVLHSIKPCGISTNHCQATLAFPFIRLMPGLTSGPCSYGSKDRVETVGRSVVKSVLHTELQGQGLLPKQMVVLLYFYLFAVCPQSSCVGGPGSNWVWDGIWRCRALHKAVSTKHRFYCSPFYLIVQTLALSFQAVPPLQLFTLSSLSL